MPNIANMSIDKKKEIYDGLKFTRDLSNFILITKTRVDILSNLIESDIPKNLIEDFVKKELLAIEEEINLFEEDKLKLLLLFEISNDGFMDIESIYNELLVDWAKFKKEFLD